jgi:type I restriction enzyme, S subunit
MSWDRKPLGMLFRLKQGRYLPPHEMEPEESRSAPVPVYGANGIIGFTSRVMYEERVPLISCRGANCGVNHLTRAPCWISNNSIACVGGEQDPRYFYYAFLNDKFSDVIGGSAQPQITISSLSPKLFEVPPLATQQRIASLLGSYDDLIENSIRRVAILEEIARNLFEELFIRCHFPESDAAPDWPTSAITEAFNIVGGGTPSKADPAYWEGGDIEWYTPTDLTRSGTMFLDRSRDRITALGLKKSGAHLFPAWSIMMTSRATLGVFAINTRPATTNQGFITAIPNENVPLYWLYYWLRANIDEFEAVASGATFKEITKRSFRKLKIAVPPRQLTTRFENTVRPGMEMALSLQRQVANLRATRDLLLPKLISGEIDVRVAEESLEVAAE